MNRSEYAKRMAKIDADFLREFAALADEAGMTEVAEDLEAEAEALTGPES